MSATATVPLVAVDPVPASRLAAYRRACKAQDKAEASASRAADLRARALADLHAEGWTYWAIAAGTGLSRARVQQLVERGREVER